MLACGHSMKEARHGRQRDQHEEAAFTQVPKQEIQLQWSGAQAESRQAWQLLQAYLCCMLCVAASDAVCHAVLTRAQLLSLSDISRCCNTSTSSSIGRKKPTGVA
jgi:hypothetical protein